MRFGPPPFVFVPVRGNASSFGSSDLSETFSAEGDIDYNKLAREIKKLGIKPHLVIEQCLEDKTEKNIDVISAHIKDLIQVKNTFK